jgi:hypothetical protein
LALKPGSFVWAAGALDSPSPHAISAITASVFRTLTLIVPSKFTRSIEVARPWFSDATPQGCSASWRQTGALHGVAENQESGVSQIRDRHRTVCYSST